MAAVLRRVLATQLPMLARNSTAHALVAATGVAGLQSAATGARSQHDSAWGRGTNFGVLAASTAAAAAALAVAAPAAADAAPPAPAAPTDPYVLPTPRGSLPRSITLYQYEVCPFCCKVKAFLDYYKLPYTTVEVNPLTKGELSWSTYRKVPVVRLDDEVVADSSVIVSRLAAELRASSSSSSRGGKSSSWRRGSTTSAAAQEEEARWRRWVDERFVKVVTANIYRSWDESWATFNYMTRQSHWPWAVQQSVRLAGAALMWRVGAGMPAKYGITGDLREALYADADAFIAALHGRPFLGGAEPNLADLSLYGVLCAVRGTDTYNDLVLHSSIGPWLARVAQVVGPSAGTPAEAVAA